MSNIIQCDSLSVNRLVVENEANQAKIILDAGDQDNAPSIKLLGKNIIEITSNGDSYCKILLKSSDSFIELSVINDVPIVKIASKGQEWSWPKKQQ